MDANIRKYCVLLIRAIVYYLSGEFFDTDSEPDAEVNDFGTLGVGIAIGIGIVFIQGA